MRATGGAFRGFIYDIIHKNKVALPEADILEKLAESKDAEEKYDELEVVTTFEDKYSSRKTFSINNTIVEADSSLAAQLLQ